MKTLVEADYLYKRELDGKTTRYKINNNSFDGYNGTSYGGKKYRDRINPRHS